MLIEGNTFSNNDTGVAIYDFGSGLTLDGTTISIHDNSITGSTDYGVNYTLTDGSILDATANWWGDPSGPVHLSNPLGSGDPVSNNVN